ncbi:MAG: hypothetical protein H0X35_10510 [Pseudonocardiales bacterium]|nr:hypothetical protein [Pseudonocardiales bacterium]
MLTFRRALRWHPPLVLFAGAMAALTLGLAVAWLVDDRTVLGAPVWAKPMKFSMSFALYALTLAWMIDQLPRGRRAGWWLGTVIVAASVVEMVIITGQAARGRRSHFTMDTPFDSALYSVMGATVAVIYLATLAVAVLLLRSRLTDPAAAWALRLGVLVSLLGMSVGFVMVARGGHAVGVPDGGPGLPLLGWSTTGGDLRVAHFTGMHALQVLPLVAALAAPRTGVARAGARVRVVLAVAAAHATLVVLLTWQALRGQPLLAPDAVTLAAAAALVAAFGTAVSLTLRSGRPRPSLVTP